MHLLESYAADTRLKIDKPFVYQKYYPLTIDKFITVHQDHRNFADIYDFWSSATSILFPHLETQGIKMVQIGSPKDTLIKGCIDLRGKTEIGQISYIINSSLLHLGSDTYSQHIASALGKKIVSLFSSNHPSNTGPYWSKSQDVISLTPNFKEGILPTYIPTEVTDRKAINTINPEDIASSVCKLLGITFEYPYKSLYIGECYKEALVEHVPNCTINVQGFSGQTLYERMDLHHDEACLDKQLSVDCGCSFSIITEKPINIEILKRHKEKIKTVFYRLDKNHSLKFAKDLLKSGVKYVLSTRESQQFADSIKIDYMDYGIIHVDEPLDPSEIDSLRDENLEDLHFSSNKFIISDRKFFPNMSYFKKEVSVPSIDTTTVYPMEDVESFLWDTEYVRIVKKNLDGAPTLS
tara:strand:- start:1318 stop:2541 length:1224 start_codon:yes stop_codon:yes gene_type:complete